MNDKIVVKTERVKYLDFIKAFSIILVVFCHYVMLNKNGIEDNVLMSICWLAVPCFFMCTGAIYCNKDVNFDKWKKKIVYTYITLIVWKLIYLIFFTSIRNIDIKIFNKIDVFKYLFCFGSLSNVDDSLMWFMYAYLSVFIISPLFKYFFDNQKDNKKFLYVMIAVLVFFGFVLSDINLLLKFIATTFSKKVYNFDTLKTIYPFSNYGKMLACYLIGGIMYKNNIYTKYGEKKKIIMFLSLLGMVISVVGLLCIKYYYTKSFAWQGVYLPTSYSTSAVLMLSICFFIFCQGINLNDKAYKCISILGKNTMGIYYMHILMIILLQKYLFPMFKFEYGVCYNLLKTVLAICLSLIVTLVIKKIPIIRKIVI